MSSLFGFLFGCCVPRSSQARQERSHIIARQTDATVIDRLTFLERQAVEDRIFAQRIAGGGENVNQHARKFKDFLLFQFTQDSFFGKDSASNNSASSRHSNR
jgi:hypothetical protein